MATEHLVFLVNADGDRAKTCVIRMQTDHKENAIGQARAQGFQNFNVIERTDSPEGFADQCVHMERG